MALFLGVLFSAFYLSKRVEGRGARRMLGACALARSRGSAAESDRRGPGACLGKGGRQMSLEAHACAHSQLPAGLGGGGGGCPVGVWSACPDIGFWSLQKELFIFSAGKSGPQTLLSLPKHMRSPALERHRYSLRRCERDGPALQEETGLRATATIAGPLDYPAIWEPSASGLGLPCLPSGCFHNQPLIPCMRLHVHPWA